MNPPPPETDVSIRPATLDDIDAVARLYVALKRHHALLVPTLPRYQVPDDEWRGVAEQALRDPGTPAFVAEASGRVLAFMKLTFRPKPWGLACEVDTMVVESEHRSKGIGAQLLAEAEDRARERGAGAMRVDVLIDNYDGREFYQRHGYAPISVRYGKPLREPD